MPKVGGGNVEKCMEGCMGDEATKKEYPDEKKRQEVCYAACNNKYVTQTPYTIADLMRKYGIKEDDLRQLIEQYKDK